MNRFLLKTLIFLTLFIILFNLVNPLIIKYKYEFINKYDRSIKESSSVEILYFGSSIDYHTHHADSNILSISEMIGSFTGLDIEGISNGANNSRLHYIFYEDFKKNNTNKDISILIFPINLRSFSKEWNENINYEFKDIQFYFDFSSLISSNKIQFSDSIQIEMDGCTYKQKVNENWKKKNLSTDYYIKYLFNIENDNQTLIALKKMNEIKIDNLIVLFYITAIDFEMGNDLIEDFENKLDENIKFLKGIMKGQHLIDLSKSLSHENFNYPFYSDSASVMINGSVNEHLNQKGRFFIADTISKYLNTIIKN